MNKSQRVFYILIFVGLISVPMLAGLWQPDLAVSETEKRELNVMPKWQGFAKSQKYFAGISDYLNDHFGFREQLVKWNNAALRSLGESPTDKVVLGNEDWVFYRTVDPLTLHTETDNYQLFRDRLRNRAKLIQERNEYSKEQGFDYVFTVVPNKMTFYKEHLPSRYAMVDLSVSYNLFVEHLRESDGSFFFDSFEWLGKVKQREERPLFFKNDTHWNNLGAYYEAIGLFEFINNTYGYTISPKEHEFSYAQTTRGDVSKLLGLMDQLKSSEPNTISPTKCVNRSNIELHEVDGISISSSACGNGELTLLYMGDSFMSYLYPYLSENVGTLFMVQEGIEFADFKKVVAFSKPDIVFEQKVERNLPKELFHP